MAGLKEAMRRKNQLEKNYQNRVQLNMQEHTIRQTAIASQAKCFNFYHPNPNLPPTLKLEIDVQELLKKEKNPSKLFITEQVSKHVSSEAEELSVKQKESKSTQMQFKSGSGTAIKVMPTDQIQRYASKFKIEWKEVYLLDSKFQALVKVELQELSSQLEDL